MLLSGAESPRATIKPILDLLKMLLEAKVQIDFTKDYGKVFLLVLRPRLKLMMPKSLYLMVAAGFN